MLMRMEGLNLTAACNAWSKAAMDFSPKVYEIMNYYLKHGKPRCLVNRNPTINFGSIIYTKIKSIKPDYDDLTMNLSAQVLSNLNADQHQGPVA